MGGLIIVDAAAPGQVGVALPAGVPAVHHRPPRHLGLGSWQNTT